MGSYSVFGLRQKNKNRRETKLECVIDDIERACNVKVDAKYIKYQSVFRVPRDYCVGRNRIRVDRTYKNSKLISGGLNAVHVYGITYLQYTTLKYIMRIRKGRIVDKYYIDLPYLPAEELEKYAIKQEEKLRKSVDN